MAIRVLAKRGEAKQGTALRGVDHGSVWRGRSGLGRAWRGIAGQGKDRGSVRPGVAGLGLARQGSWQSAAMRGVARSGHARRGTRQGTWLDVATHDVASQAEQGIGLAWLGGAGQGGAWLGTGHGKARPVKAWHSPAWQGTAGRGAELGKQNIHLSRSTE